MEMTEKQAQTLEDTHDAVIVLSSDVARLVKAIEGNGQPGVMQRLNSVENLQLTCPAREEFTSGNKNSKNTNRIALLSVAVAILAIISSML